MKATLDPELFQADPEPVDVRATVISVDDHVVEPPHLFATWKLCSENAATLYRHPLPDVVRPADA